MFGWAVVAAWGQAVPNGDFEAVGADWVDASEWCSDPLDGLPPICGPGNVGFTFDGTQARGATAGRLELETGDANASYGGDVFRARSAPFVVTHDRLTWAQTPSDVGSATLVGFAGAPTLGPASTDAFTNYELDISSACGAVVEVEIDSTDQGPVWFDDVALGGVVCPEFLDGDGDGFCPRGTDLDVDGDCADAAEVDLGADCDDADAAIRSCLDLAFEPWIAIGQRHTFTVSGAIPGDVVHLFASDALGAACPPELGGGCVDLADPVTHVGSAVADAAGVAVIRRATFTAQPYAAVLLQAAIGTAGRSEPMEGWTVPAADGPARPGGGVFNGDMEAGDLGWPPDSWGIDYGPYYYVSDPCPAGQFVSSPARDTRALSLGTLVEPAASMCPSTALGWPVIVTHHGLAWATSGPGDVELHRMSDGTLFVPGAVAGPARAADGFDEFGADVSAACGDALRIDLATDSVAVFDSIRLEGPVCAEFLDPDGDGVCPQGTDRNGDGACVGAAEIANPMLGTPLPYGRLLLDFESDPNAYTDADLAPLHALGAASGYVDPMTASEFVVLPAPEIVTHQSLALRVTTRGLGDWVGARLSVLLDYSYGGDVNPADAGPGTWAHHAVDISAGCGETVGSLVASISQADWYFDLSFDPYPWHNPDWILYDNVGFAGDACPEFVDTDADALCREGLDLDADGQCVSTGEPTPGTVQDPDE